MKILLELSEYYIINNSKNNNNVITGIIKSRIRYS